MVRLINQDYAQYEVLVIYHFDQSDDSSDDDMSDQEGKECSKL